MSCATSERCVEGQQIHGQRALEYEWTVPNETGDGAGVLQLNALGLGELASGVQASGVGVVRHCQGQSCAFQERIGE